MRWLAILLVFLLSCGPSKEEMELEAANAAKKAKYHDGDIVYVKPDSAKVVIISAVPHYDGCGCFSDKKIEYMSYEVRNTNGSNTFIKESLIYSKVESQPIIE